MQPSNILAVASLLFAIRISAIPVDRQSSPASSSNVQSREPFLFDYGAVNSFSSPVLESEIGRLPVFDLNSADLPSLPPHHHHKSFLSEVEEEILEEDQEIENAERILELELEQHRHSHPHDDQPRPPIESETIIIEKLPAAQLPVHHYPSPTTLIRLISPTATPAAIASPHHNQFMPLVVHGRPAPSLQTYLTRVSRPLGVPMPNVDHRPFIFKRDASPIPAPAPSPKAEAEAEAKPAARPERVQISTTHHDRRHDVPHMPNLRMRELTLGHH